MSVRTVERPPGARELPMGGHGEPVSGGGEFSREGREGARHGAGGGYGRWNGGGSYGDGGGFGGSGAAGGSEPALSTITTWVLLAAVVMLFMGFTSTYLSRRTGVDWRPLSMPAMLWVSTAMILASSLALEWGRRGKRLRLGLVLSLVLGLGFLAGQVLAWQELARAGVFLKSSPHSSFFYLLTVVHGVHAAAGVLWLLYAAVTLGRATVQAARRVVASAAVYWHFVGGLWVYLWVLLFWV